MPIVPNKKHPVVLVVTGWDDVGGLPETTTNEAACLPSHECQGRRRSGTLKFVSATGVSNTPNILTRLGTHTDGVLL